MTRKRTTWGAALAGCLCLVVLARPAVAQDIFPPPTTPPPADPALLIPPPAPDPFPPAATTPDPVVVLPEHLVMKNQYFAATPGGLRSYLETIRSTNPQLYNQLSPDVDRLESHQTSSIVFMAAGFVGALAAIGIGLVTRSDCAQPPVTDPNFAADSQAWATCNSDNLDRMALFSLLGVGVAAAGLVGFAATTPTRSDLLDIVNKHNRASTEPLHLQIGYDPAHQLAHAGATVSF